MDLAVSFWAHSPLNTWSSAIRDPPGSYSAFLFLFALFQLVIFNCINTFHKGWLHFYLLLNRKINDYTVMEASRNPANKFSAFNTLLLYNYNIYVLYNNIIETIGEEESVQKQSVKKLWDTLGSLGAADVSSD